MVRVIVPEPGRRRPDRGTQCVMQGAIGAAWAGLRPIGNVAAMKAAVVQFAATLDKGANRAAIAQGVREAQNKGAELVVLPEASLCGFGTPRTDLAELAESLEGPFCTALHELAAQTGTTVVAGTFEPAGGGRVHNTVVIISRGGLLGAYRKVHLYDALGWRESDRVAPGPSGGDNVPVVELSDVMLGVFTCYDLRFPESARAAVDAGATALAIPAAWVAGPYKQEHWATLTTARAIENTSYVLAAAQPAPAYSGCSRIVDPFGHVLAELGPSEGIGSPAVAVGEISAARVSEARVALPVLEHRRFALAAHSRPT